jgi:hypothetical protein
MFVDFNVDHDVILTTLVVYAQRWKGIPAAVAVLGMLPAVRVLMSPDTDIVCAVSTEGIGLGSALTAAFGSTSIERDPRRFMGGVSRKPVSKGAPRLPLPALPCSAARGSLAWRARIRLNIVQLPFRRWANAHRGEG